jgi:DNA-binding transcriptional LysR family regulator
LSDWDAARIFLTIVRQKSFRGAASELKISVNVLRRRLKGLEQSLGVTLFTRHVDGARVTPEGEKLLDAAKRMETASFDLLRARDEAGPDITGIVRLAVTEGLGTYWIAPRLIEFQRANPNLLVDLHCAYRSTDVLRLEADAAIQLTRPDLADLKMVKLGRLHFMFFASKSYLESFGTPKDTHDLVNHRILIQADENSRWCELYDRLFPGIEPAGLVAMRTNMSSAHYSGIANGGGIGMLPTYAALLGGPIVPLDLGVQDYVDIWLTYHPDVKRIARVRRVIDWVIQSFAPAKYPWFRDEFVHPHEFGAAYHGQLLLGTFAPGGPAAAE